MSEIRRDFKALVIVLLGLTVVYRTLYDGQLVLTVMPVHAIIFGLMFQHRYKWQIKSVISRIGEINMEHKIDNPKECILLVKGKRILEVIPSWYYTQFGLDDILPGYTYKTGITGWSSDSKQYESVITGDTLPTSITYNYLSDSAYICPTCNECWTDNELFEILGNDEDTYTLIKSINQCPNCCTIEF